MANSGRTRLIAALAAAIGGLAIGLLPTEGSSAELPTKPHDCFNQPLDDKDLTLVPIDEVNKDLEERARQLGSEATIVRWTRTLKNDNNYSCAQSKGRVGREGLEKKSVAPESKLSDLAKQGLRGACLRKIDLRNVDLSHADLAGANLYKADLTNADLHFAHLEGAILECANLTGTDLSGAHLQGASLKRTLLNISDLDAELDLTDALFEPFEIASTGRLVGIKGLESLHFDGDTSGLEKLRKALRDAARYDDAQKVRYSIVRSGLEKAGCVEQAFSFVMFGLTNGLGLDPWRPIWIFLTLIPIFFFVYLGLMWRKLGSIERIWPRHELGDHNTTLGVGDKRDDVGGWKGYPKFLTVFYFSVLSSLHLKLADIDPGAQIARMQPRLYRLRATKWLRLASGLQSIVSFYLLALWAFTYLGNELRRIFE